MFRIADDAHFWDRSARKYATDPIADIAGDELEISRKWRKPGASEFVIGTMQAAR